MRSALIIFSKNNEMISLLWHSLKKNCFQQKLVEIDQEEWIFNQEWSTFRFHLKAKGLFIDLVSCKSLPLPKEEKLKFADFRLLDDLLRLPSSPGNVKSEDIAIYYTAYWCQHFISARLNLPTGIILCFARGNSVKNFKAKFCSLAFF